MKEIDIAYVSGDTIGPAVKLKQAIDERDMKEPEASRIFTHELDHAKKDRRRHGWLGLIVVVMLGKAKPEEIDARLENNQELEKDESPSDNEIEVREKVIGAYYRPIGPRTAEEMLEMAEAPDDPSGPDRAIALMARSMIEHTKSLLEQSIEQFLKKKIKESIKRREGVSINTPDEVIYPPAPSSQLDYQSLPLAA
jgi:hypothetical protein